MMKTKKKKRGLCLFPLLLLLLGFTLGACNSTPAGEEQTGTDTATEKENQTTMQQTNEPIAPSTAIRLLSWNIHGYEEGNTSHDQSVLRVLNKLNADLTVLNESTDQLWEEHPELAETYGWVSTAFGGKYATGNAILYRRERFESVSTYTYCLTDTPTKYSKVPESHHYRFATFAELRDRLTGRTLTVIGTHLENNSNNKEIFPERNRARIAQAGHLIRLMREEIPAGSAVVLMGDLNGIRDSKPEEYRLGGITELLESGLLTDIRDLAEQTDWSGSWAGADFSFDYILVTPGAFTATRFFVKQSPEIQNPSDHNPILAVADYAR